MSQQIPPLPPPPPPATRMHKKSIFLIATVLVLVLLGYTAWQHLSPIIEQLNRSPTSPTARKSFITPNDPVVKNTLNDILRSKFFLVPEWIAIKDWVANNIQYESDQSMHGVADYWQFPKETIQSRKGDCEDRALLMVSLLRVNGWDANRVYVILGYTTSEGHAWVRLNVDIIGWQNLEATPWWNSIIGDNLGIIIQGYDDVCQFNDMYYANL